MKFFPESKSIFLVALGLFFLFFGFGGAQQYLVPLFKLEGREVLGIVALLTIYTFALVGSFFTPQIIRRIGARQALIASSIMYIPFIAGAGTMDTLALIFISAIVGIAAGPLWVAAGSIVTESSHSDRRGLGLGFYYSSFLLGSSFGAGAGALLVQRLSFGMLYAFFGVAAFLGVLCFSALPRIKEEAPPPESEMRFSFIFNRKLLIFLPLIFAEKFINAQTISAVNLIALQLFGIAALGVIVTVLRFSSVVGAFSIGAFSDRLRKETVLALLVILGIVGVMLLVFVPQIWAMVVAVMLIGFLTSANQPVLISLWRGKMDINEHRKALSVLQGYTSFAFIAGLAVNLYFTATGSMLISLPLLLLALGVLVFSGRLIRKPLSIS